MHTNITDQLPYELCDGVVATVDGIEPVLEKLPLIEAIKEDTRLTNGPRRRVAGHGVDWRTYWSWEDVAKVLQYKKNKPGITLCEEGLTNYWWLVPATHVFYSDFEVARLHRYAAILCDDAEAFRVLYQCIKEFGDARD